MKGRHPRRPLINDYLYPFLLTYFVACILPDIHFAGYVRGAHLRATASQLVTRRTRRDARHASVRSPQFSPAVPDTPARRAAQPPWH